MLFLMACFLACGQGIYIGYPAETMLKAYDYCEIEHQDSLGLKFNCPAGGYFFEFDKETLLCISSGMSFSDDMLTRFEELIKGQGYEKFSFQEINDEKVITRTSYCKEGFSCVLIAFKETGYLAMFSKYDDCQ